jgi:hypothetical protein
MSQKSAGRVRNVVLVVVIGGTLAVSSCQTGGQGVTVKQACHSGALFECANPKESNA